MKTHFFIPFTLQLLWFTQPILAVSVESTGMVATGIKSFHERHHRTPQFVQDLSYTYAEALCRPCNPFDWIKLWAKKIIGSITVYDGPALYSPQNFFEKNPDILSYFNKGIHFPRGIFKDNKISPEQRVSLAHEVVHAMRNTKISKDPAYLAQEEYIAHKCMIEILFKLKDYEALKLGLFEMFLGSKFPHYFGARDGFFNIVKNHSHEPEVEKLRKGLLHFAFYWKKDAEAKHKDAILKNDKKTEKMYEIEILRTNEIIELFSNVKKYESQVS